MQDFCIKAIPALIVSPVLTHIFSSCYTPLQGSHLDRAFCNLIPTFHTLVTDQFQDMVTCHMLQAPTVVFQMLPKKGTFKRNPTYNKVCNF